MPKTKKAASKKATKKPVKKVAKGKQPAAPMFT